MKCLEKDRTRRYETVNGLARDVQRFLKDEPVEACPPSLAYRLRKLAGKHRGLLVTAASFLALLVIGSLVSAGLAMWAVHAQHAAEAALVREHVAHSEAVAAKERAESYSQRLRSATQLVSEGNDYYNRTNWALAHDRFTKATQIEPDLSSIYQNRKALYTTLGLWDRAAADYDRSFQLATRFNANAFNEHATLKLYLGDDAAYRRICQDTQFVGSTTNNDIFCWLHACVLSPRPVGDSAYLAQRGERLVSNWYVPWTLHACALAHLRAGHYEQAATRSREALKFPENTGIYRCNNLPLAMALHHLGKHDEARQVLSQAKETIDNWITAMADGSPGTLPVDWHKWLGAYVIYREAKLLLTGAPLEEDPRLTMIRERALAAITYGDAFTFMDAGREQVKRNAWDAAAASFGNVLDQLPRGFRSGSQEMRFCVEMTQEPEVFKRLVERKPRDVRLWYARGRMSATRGEWTKASADFAKALELVQQDMPGDKLRGLEGPQIGRSVNVLELAPLRLLAGDEAGYHELCAAYLAESFEGGHPLIASAFTRAFVLRPDTTEDWSIPLMLARQAVQVQPRVAWYLFALGAVEHRAGHEEEAIETLKQSLEVHTAWVGRGQNYVVLAMACFKLGQREEARDWFTKAKASLNDMNDSINRSKFGYAASDYLGDWLSIQVLLPEAEKLLASDQKP